MFFCRCSLLVVFCSLFVICRSWLGVCCLLLVVDCSLFIHALCCLFFVVRCLLCRCLMLVVS